MFHNTRKVIDSFYETLRVDLRSAPDWHIVQNVMPVQKFAPTLRFLVCFASFFASLLVYASMRYSSRKPRGCRFRPRSHLNWKKRPSIRLVVEPAEGLRSAGEILEVTVSIFTQFPCRVLDVDFRFSSLRDIPQQYASSYPKALSTFRRADLQADEETPKATHRSSICRTTAAWRVNAGPLSFRRHF
jgi:hypothetical protein